MTIRTPSARRIVAVLCGLTLALPACSSSGGNGSSTTPRSSAAGSTGHSLTGTPIKIGLIGSLSGVQASSSDQGATVGPAWQEYVNQQLGGIDGHPVQVIVEDDKGQPTTAQSAANTLVNDGVVAVVVSSDNLVNAFDTTLINAKIPVIAGSNNSPDWSTKQGMYQLPTDVASFIVSNIDVANRFAHAKSFADLYCAEIAACASLNPPMKSEAAKLHVSFTDLAVSSSASSYTAPCLALKQKKVDYVQLSLATAAAVKIISDCQQQGYNPTFGIPGEVFSPDFLKIKNLTAYGPDIAFASFGDSPASASFRSIMQKYAKGDNWHEGVAGVTWAGLEAVRAAIAKSGTAGEPTATTVATGLAAFSNETLGGVLPNGVSFPGGKAAGFDSHPCVFVVGIKDGKETSPNGDAPFCP